MASQWYCLTDDEEGPFTFNELARRLARGELLSGDLVRRQESSEWRRADAVFGLMRAARQISTSTALARSSVSTGWLGRMLLGVCQRMFPSLEAEQLLIGVSLLFVLIFAVEVLWYWTRWPAKFPAPSAKGIIIHGPDRLQQLRPAVPPLPTLASLQRGVPTIVPGFERVHWMKSPALSADLLTVVYVGYAGTGQLDDLMIAERGQPTGPFRNHRPLRALNSAEREAHPALSPDGRELIFSRLGNPAGLWISRREDRNSPFSPPRRLVLKNDPDQDRHHDAPHYLGPQLLCVTISDVDFKERQQWLIMRDSSGGFVRTSAVSLVNPWPRYFLTAGGKRAFLPTPDGLQVTARGHRSRPFEEPEILFPTETTGPDLTASDDTIWVTPAEDIIFYCGPGPHTESKEGRRFWMIRL